MATQPIEHSKFIKTTGGRLEWYEVTASAAIKKGDILTVASSKVDQSIALPGTNSTGTASGGNLPIACVAEENFTADASGVSTDGQSRTKILCRVIDDTFVLETRGYHATASSSEQRDFAIDTAYQFQRWRGADASTWWYEMITTTTDGEFKCINRSPNSAAADDYGINRFKAALSSTIRELG
jgi:hypothetical protein